MRRFERGVDDVLAEPDERAAHCEVVQDTRIVAHIGQRGRGLGEARQIGVSAHFHEAGIGLHRRVQGQRRDNAAAALETCHHHVEQPRMQRIVEMLGFENRRDALDRLIVDQDRAEQGLLDIDVVWDVAVNFVFHDGSELSPCLSRCRLRWVKAGGESIDARRRPQGACRLAHS